MYEVRSYNNTGTSVRASNSNILVDSVLGTHKNSMERSGLLRWSSAMNHRRHPVIAVIPLLFWLAGSPARAEEVLVRNDSVANFSEVYIFGDFIRGEQGGVVLDSPCNGNIVAIQILWLEGIPGNDPSLEEAIHIYSYNPGGFPVPGTEMERLEGPLLYPGAWNEYRYVDEAGTIPLKVPVVAGQKFYVALEFYNPTNVQGGSASLVRDVDGFKSGRNALYGNVQPFGWRWWDFNAYPVFLLGDVAIRAIIDCPGATGACCHADATCTPDVEAEDCNEFGDVWYEGKTCAEIDCTARGACCVASGCARLITPTQCAQLNGTYAGHGTDCDDGVCVAGACCNPDTGQCVQAIEVICIQAGGVFQGPGTSCEPNPCPPPIGACCVGEICVPDQTPASCLSIQGTWQGVGTDCGPPDPCAPRICRGDLNCDDVIDFNDINVFVLALSNWPEWQARYPDCPEQNADVNADGLYGGANGFGDINPFVKLLGSSGGQPIPCE